MYEDVKINGEVHTVHVEEYVFNCINGNAKRVSKIESCKRNEKWNTIRNYVIAELQAIKVKATLSQVNAICSYVAHNFVQ